MLKEELSKEEAFTGVSNVSCNVRDVSGAKGEPLQTKTLLDGCRGYPVSKAFASVQIALYCLGPTVAIGFAC